MRSTNLIGFAILTLALLGPAPSEARGLWDNLLRQSAGVGDSVRITRADELAEQLSRSKTVTRRVDDLTGSANALGRRARVRALLGQSLKQSDAGLVRQIEQLDAGAQNAALILARGGQTLKTNIPDIATRGRLMQQGGPELVAAAGLHGKPITRAALRLDAALSSGRLALPPGVSKVTLQDFGRVMTRGGKASAKFWKNHVRPNWGKWLTGGVIAAWIANPDAFQTAAGELSAAGGRRVGELVGAVGGGIARGVGEGATEAVRSIGTGLRVGFFSSPASFMGLLLLLLGGSLFFRRPRQVLFAPIRWLQGEEAKPNARRRSSPRGSRRRAPRR
jgi:hypothetical protein